MQSRSWLLFATILLALVSLSWTPRALALDDEVASPIVHDNMAVYPIKSHTTAGPVPLTIDRAIHGGLAKIHDGTDAAVTVDNNSGHSIFVPFGTLLTGGLQDQVVATGTLVPPNAQGVPIDVFCVDPFRSTPRLPESADAFETSGALMPWRIAKLNMLLNSADSRVVKRIRQSGVWWSIDTVRSRLQKELGTELEPPKSVPWSRDFSSDNRAILALASRASPWTTSLPMSLGNRRLAQSLAPYLRAFENTAFAGTSVAGAVFVINGQVAGAETYRSPRLFQQMWPHLVRAYATEAIAEKELPSVPLPSTAAIDSFLSEAIVAQAPDWIIGDHTYVRDGHAVLYSESRDENGFWIEATYLPKALPKGMALTPDALAADVLEQGKVNGLSIDSLSNSDVVTFRQDLGAGASVAAISSASPATSASLPPTEGNRVMPDERSQSRVISIIAIWL